MSNRSLIWLPALLIILGGCATIVHGPRKDIRVSSQPLGATVFVNNEAQGTTPVSLRLRRKKRYFLRLEAEGYEEVRIQLRRSVDEWAIVGCLFAFPLSCIIDWASGSGYDLEPRSVYVEMNAVR